MPLCSNMIWSFLGSSEDEAKLRALQNALHSLSPLFGYPSLPGADRVEVVQNQLSSMLNGARQKEPVIDLKSEERASIKLSFCDYMLKCTCQSSKKAAQKHLCERILGLLAVKTGQSHWTPTCLSFLKYIIMWNDQSVLNLLQKQTMHLWETL